jgi:hypothetical protein
MKAYDPWLTRQYKGRRIIGGHSKHQTLDNLHATRDGIARTIAVLFPDQEVTDATQGARATIVVDGVTRRFDCFEGFRPDLRTVDYDKDWHRKKRERWMQLNNLLMAYQNAAIAVEIYENLQADVGDKVEDAIDMLAEACWAIGEQYAEFAQWAMSIALRPGRKGAATTNKDHVELHEQYRHDVSALIKPKKKNWTALTLG